MKNFIVRMLGSTSAVHAVEASSSKEAIKKVQEMYPAKKKDVKHTEYSDNLAKLTKNALRAIEDTVKRTPEHCILVPEDVSLNVFVVSDDDKPADLLEVRLITLVNGELALLSTTDIRDARYRYGWPDVCWRPSSGYPLDMGGLCKIADYVLSC